MNPLARLTPSISSSPVDERTGFIRYVFDLPIEPGEPRIFNASVKMADTGRYMPAACFDNNGGSGLTREAARNAAIGEGIERYCATCYDAADLLFGTAQELSQRYTVSAPEKFALFHPDQHIVEVPPFTQDTPIAWTWGFSLVRLLPVLVPACQVYMPYFPCFQEQGERVIGPVVSTGLACARTLDEALLKSIYEVVERDAFMITWMNQLPMPRVDFTTSTTLNDLYCDRLQREGLNYILIDTTTDIAIPSYLCILIDEHRSPPMICAGGATSLDPIQAAAKALLEAVQTREWAKFMGRTGKACNYADDFSDVREFEDHVALYAYSNMLPAIQFLLTNPQLCPMNRHPIRAGGNCPADLKESVLTLAANDFDVIALDLTTPDVAECGYFVTKILVPGLQPLDADYLHRFLGGLRLYQLPHRLGFTSTDTRIEQLNPYPHPYP